MAFVFRRAAATNFRRYSTAAPSSAPGTSSKTGLYIGVTSVLGLAAAYYYMQDTPAPAAPKVPLTSALDKDNFVDLKLKKIEPYNHNTAKFTFELPPNTASLLPVAACVVIKTAPGKEDPDHPPLLDAKGKPYVRPYTPISPSDHPEEITFLIKKYDTGKVTPYLHAMKPGQTIGIKGPFPKTPYKVSNIKIDNAFRTPMYQIIQHAMSLPDDKTKITFLFSNVSEADILMRETLDAWAQKHPDRLKIVYALDKGSDKWDGPTGYVSKEMIQKYLPAPSDKVQILVCGPPGQVKSVAGAKDGMKQGELGGVLKELGYTQEQVFKF
ncbi:NADH-cytochrome b5 reductase [Tulasnella sp. 408]|nr:NADH-cytochrome b5 reductase [Tulasnella sp. 408]